MIAKKPKQGLEVASVRLLPGMFKEISRIAKTEGKTRSSMTNYLVEIGLAAYGKGDAKDVADLRRKLREIQIIIEA
jgi:hypothetical protein